jgi:hypothetical protein|tara:strand:+ start:48 stop:605 length:558 start_codon:yes stop_codon:yes gene_type:complete
MTIDIYDNVLESDLSTLIDTEMKKVRWKYDYNSHKGEVNKHWHIHCGDANIKPQYSFIQHIWDVGKERYNFEEKYKVNKFKRVYCNSHTHGIEPHLHHDDGDFTMIYYPRLDWKPEWLGGTVIWNKNYTEIEKYVNYIPNRLFVFDAKLPHQAMPVSRQCYELRTCIVFKTYAKDALPWLKKLQE